MAVDREAAQLGASETEAEARLTGLEEQGVVASRRVDEATRIWWPRGDGTRTPDAGVTADLTVPNETGVLVIDDDQETRRPNGSCCRPCSTRGPVSAVIQTI